MFEFSISAEVHAGQVLNAIDVNQFKGILSDHFFQAFQFDWCVKMDTKFGTKYFEKELIEKKTTNFHFSTCLNNDYISNIIIGKWLTALCMMEIDWKYILIKTRIFRFYLILCIQFNESTNSLSLYMFERMQAPCLHNFMSVPI